jgi:hypothetical protein
MRGVLRGNRCQEAGAKTEAQEAGGMNAPISEILRRWLERQAEWSYEALATDVLFPEGMR